MNTMKRVSLMLGSFTRPLNRNKCPEFTNRRSGLIFPSHVNCSQGTDIDLQKQLLERSMVLSAIHYAQFCNSSSTTSSDMNLTQI